MTLVVWPPQAEDWLEAITEAAGTVPVVAPTTEAAALEAATQAEGWIGRVSREILLAAPRLRWLQAPTISLENVIIPELVDSNITLTNMRHIYDDHIANHVLALFLALCRDLPRLMRGQIAKEWLPGDQIQVLDPTEMTVVILGLGGIGSEVARRLGVFCPTVLGVDPLVRVPPEGVSSLHRPETLPDLLSQADAVIICAPLTPETTDLWGEALFQRMKRTALFINIGRGKIVQLPALERALAEGWIAAAGLDVFAIEPLPPTSPLWSMSNVILTPHCAGFGPHTERRRLDVVVENVRRFVADQPLLNVADKARWF